MVTYIRSMILRTLSILAVFAVGCDLLPNESGPVWALRPGTVVFYDEPIVIEHPDTTDLRRPVRIRVRTYGGGCTEKGPTLTVIAEMTITLEPLDSVLQPHVNQACPDILKLYDHIVNVSVPRSGAYTVRVIGNREPEAERIELERSVIVR